LGRISVGSSGRGLGGAVSWRGQCTITIHWRWNPVGGFGLSSSGSKSAFEVPAGTSRARKLLVTLGFRLRTVAAGNWCSASRFGYHRIRR
jgi:hypothetical protein